MDRAPLAEFLRHRREALRPADVGLVAGGRRRVPGLRRDEVAMLAAMSTDYYERLEQNRGPQPSPEMLGAIARALRLSPEERDHLYALAGHEPPPGHRAQGYADAGLMYVLDALAPTVPAMVVDDVHDVLAQNPLAVALLGPLAAASGRDRNFLWRWFAHGLDERYADDQRDTLAREYVADLRRTSGLRPDDPSVRRLVADLTAASAEFRAIWARLEVGRKRSSRKAIRHEQVGLLDLECDVVVSEATGHRLVVFRPRPGTDAAEKLELLRVLGVQHLDADPADPPRAAAR